MIIVARQIRVRKANGEAFVRTSQDAMQAARTAQGCHDFTVAADPIEADRVNVFERWESLKGHPFTQAFGHPERPMMFVASDDDSAKAVASKLVDELGFQALDRGGLRTARLLEPLAMP